MLKHHDLSKYIDHTILKSDALQNDIEAACAKASELFARSVCINPAFVKAAADVLKGTETRVGSVVGFPLGANTTLVKVYEAETTENEGATEIDMVLNIGAVKAAETEYIEHEIHEVRKALSSQTVLKVILECPLLTDAQKITFTQIAVDSGADFVKTCTGFFGAATVKDVELLFKIARGKAGVKAAGGIRDLRTALSMIEAGASRIGTSSGIEIIEQYRNQTKK